MINIIEQDVLALKIETFTKNNIDKEINVSKEENYSLKHHWILKIKLLKIPAVIVEMIMI